MVLAALEQPMRQNTAFYRNDFEIDKEMIRQAAASDRGRGQNAALMSPTVQTVLFPGARQFSYKTPGSIIQRFYGSRPVTVFWPTPWS